MRKSHTDLPLNETDGPVLARFVVQKRVPVILSLRHLSKTKQKRFVADFCEHVYELKGAPENRDPLPIFIDEASTFVPQTVRGDAARMVGAIEELVRRGRSSGIGCILIDQRPASVNKDVLTQVEVMIAHQVNSPQDRKALKEWVDAHDDEGHGVEFMKSLAGLKKGEAWVWSPSWLDVFERVKVAARTTFDSSSTPKAGKKRVLPKKLAEVDLEEVKGELAASIEEAERTDPTKLQRRIAELERDAAAKPKAVDQSAVDAAIAIADRRARAECAKAILPVIAQIRSTMSDVRGRLDGVESSTKGLEAFLDSLPAPQAASKPVQAPTHSTPKITAEPTTTRTRHAKGPNNGNLPSPQQRIVDSIAWWNAAGVDQPSRGQVAFVARYSEKGSSFRNPAGALNSAELVCIPVQGKMAFTRTGVSHAAAPTCSPSLGELCDRIRAVLKSGPLIKLFDVLLDQSHPISRAEWAGLAGYSADGSSFRNPAGRLRSLGLVEYPTQGMVKLSSIFDGGRW